MAHRGQARRSKRKVDKFVGEAEDKALEYLGKELDQLLASQGNAREVAAVLKCIRGIKESSQKAARRKNPASSRRTEFDFGALAAQEARENPQAELPS